MSRMWIASGSELVSTVCTCSCTCDPAGLRPFMRRQRPNSVLVRRVAPRFWANDCPRWRSQCVSCLSTQGASLQAPHCLVAWLSMNLLGCNASLFQEFVVV
mmetsp:Transcript_109542/g.349475  ORF Transcript_109542/g.349475 Transcript_109542/m.349475 type:complete len:101 (+) Transcript_109542:890-1192(+)